MIDTSTTIVAVKNAAFSEINGEIAILNLNNGTYYGLNDVGAFVWKYIQEPRTLDEVCSAVMAEFEVSSEVCHKDLGLLMQEMAEQGLVETREA